MKPFKLASWEQKGKYTHIKIDAPEPLLIGDGYCTIIAGPCAVENEEGYLQIARFLREAGAHALRGGLFKPRTSPYTFRGLGREGLEIMLEARRITGLPLVSEIMDTRDLEFFTDNIDVLQVGSRNMQNFSLLEELGKLQKPILLKRGLSATIEEWLLAAEYVLEGGNPNIILCERGIRTFESYLRNTVDIGAVALLKELSHLPVLVDPSHATGKREMVTPVARAAIAAGADGLMVEVHPNPDLALSDGEQSLTPENFKMMYGQVMQLSRLVKSF